MQIWGSFVGTAILCCHTSAAVQTAGPNLNLTKAAGNQFETAVTIHPKSNSQIFVVSRNAPGGLYTARSSDGSLSLSKDGGATFCSPTGTGALLMLPFEPPNSPVLGDQPTVTVGPGSAGYPGSVWVTYWTMGGGYVSGAGVSGLGIVGPFATTQPPQPSGVNFGGIAVGPSGEVMVTYGPNSGTSGKIYTNVKLDGLGGRPFAASVSVVSVNIGGFTRIPAQPNWGIDPEAGLAWDRSTGPHHGRVHLVYTDAPVVGSADTNLFVVHSDDMGTTLSAPLRVNDDKGTNSQFLPRISLDQSNGMIAVTWYDARHSSLNNTTRYFGAFSSDGGTTFGPNFPIAVGTSNQANSVSSLKKVDYGDYTGNAFSNGRLVPAWADKSNSTADRPDGATNFDVYTSIAGVAAGTRIEIYGTNLANGTRDWAATDWAGNVAPAQLDKVQVTVGGKLAAISHISPGQVNAQAPDGIGVGPVQVVVTNNGLASDPAIVQASAIRPGLLAPPAFKVGDKHYVVAIAGNGSTFVGLPSGFQGGRPAIPGEVITLYGIGFGPVTPLVLAGTITAVLNGVQNAVSVLIDQIPADLSAPSTYAGLAPGAVGLYQLNLVVPNVPDGDHALKVSAGNTTLPQNLFIATKQ